MQSSDTPWCKRTELLLAQCKPVLMKYLLEHFAKVTFWWTGLLFPGRAVWSHFETGWLGLSPIIFICLYFPFLSALHIACLTASAFLVSAPPLGCYLNVADLINWVLSICDIKNASAHILVEDSGMSHSLLKPAQKGEWWCPKAQVQFCLLPEIFVCSRMSLDAVSMYKWC